MAGDLPELELYDETVLTTEQLRELAKEAEAAAWEVPGITNSLGASASAGYGGIVLATSDGFVGAYHSLVLLAVLRHGRRRRHDHGTRL